MCCRHNDMAGCDTRHTSEGSHWPTRLPGKSSKIKTKKLEYQMNSVYGEGGMNACVHATHVYYVCLWAMATVCHWVITAWIP